MKLELVENSTISKGKESQSNPLPSPGIPKLAFKNGDFHISQNEETKDFPISQNHLPSLVKKETHGAAKILTISKLHKDLKSSLRTLIRYIETR